MVVTGNWDRAGELGGSGANAWTAMPGGGVLGAVLERAVARDANLVAHELGHSLGLGHEDEETNLMHPVIYPRSWRLAREQCAAARAASRRHRSRMLR